LRLCVDLGGSAIRAALMDQGNLLAALTAERSASFDITDLQKFVERALAKFGTDAVAGIAVAVPGVIDVRRSTLVSAHGKYSALVGADLKSWASSHFAIPFGLENDARAALMGELTFGIAAGETDAVLMVLGTGIGTAAVIDGVHLYGRHGHAGILGGHVTIDRNAPACPCGNVGCAESLASTWALTSALRDTPNFSDSAWALQPAEHGIKGLVRLAHDGDYLSQQTLSHFINAWAITLVSLCHAYDPNVVIVTGGVLQAAGIAPLLQSYLHAHLWSSAYRPKLLVPVQPQLSVMRGLSALNLHESAN